jgi:hypothetical protein
MESTPPSYTLPKISCRRSNLNPLHVEAPQRVALSSYTGFLRSQYLYGNETTPIEIVLVQRSSGIKDTGDTRTKA